MNDNNLDFFYSNSLLIIENLFLVYYNIKTTENQNPIPLYTKKSLCYPFGRQREYN